MQTTKERVAANVARARKAAGLTVRQLSAMLGDMGVPILPSGITKIEQASRDVSAQELLALATALNTTPGDLLIYSEGPLSVAITPYVQMSAEDAFAWVSSAPEAAGSISVDGMAKATDHLLPIMDAVKAARDAGVQGTYIYAAVRYAESESMRRWMLAGKDFDWDAWARDFKANARTWPNWEVRDGERPEED